MTQFSEQEKNMMDKYRYKAEEIYSSKTGLPFPITPTKEEVARLMEIVKDLYQSEIYGNRGNNINNPSLNMEVNNVIFESYKELDARTKKIDDAITRKDDGFLKENKSFDSFSSSVRNENEVPKKVTYKPEKRKVSRDEIRKKLLKALATALAALTILGASYMAYDNNQANNHAQSLIESCFVNEDDGRVYFGETGKYQYDERKIATEYFKDERFQDKDYLLATLGHLYCNFLEKKSFVDPELETMTVYNHIIEIGKSDYNILLGPDNMEDFIHELGVSSFEDLEAKARTVKDLIAKEFKGGIKPGEKVEINYSDVIKEAYHNTDIKRS